MGNLSQIEELFRDSIVVKQKCIEEGFESIRDMGDLAVSSIKNGNKIMLCGNGGSASCSRDVGAS